MFGPYRNPHNPHHLNYATARQYHAENAAGSRRHEPGFLELIDAALAAVAEPDHPGSYLDYTAERNRLLDERLEQRRRALRPTPED